MSSPFHHPTDALLTDYVTGAAPEALSLFVAAHTSLCIDCVEHIAEEEAIAAALFRARERPRRDDLLARVLSRLDEPAPPAPCALVSHPWIPAPLLPYTGTEPVWQPVVPGLDLAFLPLSFGDEQVVLTRVSPGGAVPLHTHRGMELQLVLTGGYTATDGHFGRGDAHCVDARVRHSFVVDPGEPCISLLVRQGRIRPLTPEGRQFAKLTGA